MLDLKNKIFEARSQLDIRQSKIQIEHQEALREMEMNYQTQLEQHRWKLRSALFGRAHTVPTDDVDVFLNVLRGPQPSPEEIRERKHRESLESELTRFEKANHVSEGRIKDLKEKIDNLRKKLNEFENSEEDESVDIIAPVPDLSAEIAEVKKVHESMMKKIEQQKAEETQIGTKIQHEIETAREESEKLQQKKAAEAKAKAESQQKQKKKMGGVGTPHVVTLAERRARIEALLQEEKRLQKEIARLDFMIYGRAGKYQKWRNII
jgi:hypothetical protein